jgi:hypothetical protein
MTNIQMLEVLAEDNFQHGKREKLLGYDIYYEEADHLASTIPRGRRNLSNLEWLASKDDGQKMLAASTVARISLDFMTLGYSAGVNLAELRAFYPSVVESWLTHEKYHVAYGQGPSGIPSTAATYALLGDAFDFVNRMVCFGVLLGWGNQLFHIARIIEYRNPRMDGMLERLLSYYVPNRDISLTECTRDQPYVKTLKIFNATADARPAMMAEYLEDWYIASRCEPYYDSHARDTSFKGYWSWEAAAITFLLNIDDSSYRTAEFYPADLVDFARNSNAGNRRAV